MNPPRMWCRADSPSRQNPSISTYGKRFTMDAPTTFSSATVSPSEVVTRQIGDGKCDHIPEQAFYMAGTITEVCQRAQEMGVSAAA